MSLNRKKWYVLTLVCLLTVALVGACAAYYKKESYVNVDGKMGLLRDVDPPEAFAIITRNRSNPKFVLRDVRTAGEDEKEHLVGAILIDYRLPNFQEEINKLDRTKAYVIYCRVGNRSGDAFAVMREFKFKEVYNIFGGIKAWKAGDLPVVHK